MMRRRRLSTPSMISLCSIHSGAVPSGETCPEDHLVRPFPGCETILLFVRISLGIVDLELEDCGLSDRHRPIECEETAEAVGGFTRNGPHHAAAERGAECGRGQGWQRMPSPPR